MKRLVGIICVLTSMLCEAFGNIAFKHAANSGEEKTVLISALASALRQYKSILIGLLCFVTEAVFWSFSLHFLDVSQAFPIGSAELIIVLILSRIMLKETIGPRRWAGVAIIIAGTILVGLSK